MEERAGYLSYADMFDLDSINNADGMVKDSVGGFYHFENGVLVCDANNNDMEVGRYIVDSILGGSIDFTEYTPPERPSPDGGSDVGIVTGTSDSCQGAGGAGALGWIVCPVMEWMGGAAEYLYEDMVEPQLRVEPVLFGADGNNNTRDAWKKFQGIANILFSILLLVVIFSQLTGVGIDNYGIKKILPKLILTAVLANLSFVICQLAVDVSNILGNSLQDLLSSMGGNISAFNVITPDGSVPVGNNGIGPTAVTGVILVAALAAGGIAIATNPAILLSLLVGALGVLIAILFVFILLAARQAAIVILVVISPLAFVCYALPNTKKLFDKWLNLMKGLLVVYPICGLLIGGGNFASKLVLAAGGNNMGFVTAFTAMLMSIVPLFYVPIILEKAMNAIDGLGGRIRGVGGRVGSGAKGLARNSRGYKNAQQRGNERAERITNRRRAGIHLDRDGNVQNNRLSVRRRIAGTGLGRLLGMDAAVGAAQARYVKEEMDRRGNINTFENRGIVETQAAEAQNAEIARIGKGNAGVARTNEEYETQLARNAVVQKEEQIAAGAPELDTAEARATLGRKFANEKAKTEIEMEVGIAPINRDNVRQRAQNALNEALADNHVGVVPVDVDLATQRRQAAADAQELRNYTDQFANFSRADLEKEAKEFSTKFAGATTPEARAQVLAGSNTQKMQALLSTMESRGMEGAMADMLEAGGDVIGNNAAVMQTLTGSKNRVFKAYGKAGAGENGEGLSYREFMSGGAQLYMDANGNVTKKATDANGNANFTAYVDADTGEYTMSNISASGKANSLANSKSITSYARDKGADFINDLDDKALSQIAKYESQNPQLHIMDNATLAQAASRINSQDAVDQIDNMISRRIDNGEKVEFTSQQFAGLNASTRNQLLNRAANSNNPNDMSVVSNMVRISDEIMNDPERRSKLDADTMKQFNIIRARVNKPPMGQPQPGAGGSS